MVALRRRRARFMNSAPPTTTTTITITPTTTPTPTPTPTTTTTTTTLIITYDITPTTTEPQGAPRPLSVDKWLHFYIALYNYV